MNTNSLRLVDLDDVYLIEKIEKCFGIKLPNDKVSNCETVGDLHDAVLSEFAVPRNGGPVCFTAVAFYRIRQTWRDCAPSLTLRPSTSLRRVAGSANMKALWRRLGNDGRMKAPELMMGHLAAIVALAMISAAIWLTLILDWRDAHWTAYFVPFALAVLSFPIMIAAARERPKSETVGELATGIAALNMGRLAREHRWWRERDLWKALVWLCREQTGMKIAVTRETRLI